MKVIHKGRWTFQIYWPQIILKKEKDEYLFNMKFGLAITIAHNRFGFEILGFGVGIGHYNTPYTKLNVKD